MESLSLAAQLYLLAWHPRRERVLGRWQLGSALRAAALAELVGAGRLAIERGRVVLPAHAGSTGRAGRRTDPVLDDLVAATSAGAARTIGQWIKRGQRQTRTAVRDQLVAGGVIELGPARSFGLPTGLRVRVGDPRVIEALHARTHRALAGGPAEAPEATLVVLAAAAELRPFLSPRQRRAHRSRIADLTAMVGDPLPAIAKALKAARPYAG